MQDYLITIRQESLPIGLTSPLKDKHFSFYDHILDLILYSRIQQYQFREFSRLSHKYVIDLDQNCIHTSEGFQRIDASKLEKLRQILKGNDIQYNDIKSEIYVLLEEFWRTLDPHLIQITLDYDPENKLELIQKIEEKATDVFFNKEHKKAYAKYQLTGVPRLFSRFCMTTYKNSDIIFTSLGFLFAGVFIGNMMKKNK